MTTMPLIMNFKNGEGSGGEKKKGGEKDLGPRYRSPHSSFIALPLFRRLCYFFVVMYILVLLIIIIFTFSSSPNIVLLGSRASLKRPFYREVL